MTQPATGDTMHSVLKGSAAMPTIVLVSREDIEMWPDVSWDSALWSLEYARDTSRIMTAIEQADADRQIENYDAIMGWLFDLCNAYYVIVAHTTIMEPKLGLMYLDMLKDDLKYRPSPLLWGPENLEDSAKTTFVMLCRRFRPLSERYPRLLASMKWVACLSDGEAQHALAAYLRGETWAGEAVNHFGGTERVIEQAYAKRRSIGSMEAKFCWTHGVALQDAWLHYSIAHTPEKRVKNDE